MCVCVDVTKRGRQTTWVCIQRDLSKKIYLRTYFDVEVKMKFVRNSSCIIDVYTSYGDHVQWPGHIVFCQVTARINTLLIAC